VITQRRVALQRSADGSQRDGWRRIIEKVIEPPYRLGQRRRQAVDRTVDNLASQIFDAPLKLRIGYAPRRRPERDAGGLRRGSARGAGGKLGGEDLVGRSKHWQALAQNGTKKTFGKLPCEHPRVSRGLAVYERTRVRR
jgi:hypothetical protein